MNRMQNEKKLEALAKELAKGLKTEKDLSMLRLIHAQSSLIEAVG